MHSFRGKNYLATELKVSRIIQELPGWHSGKESACQCWRHRRCKFDPWVGKISWRRAWQPTPVFLPGESHGQRSLAGYSPWGHRESDTTEQLSMRASMQSFSVVSDSLRSPWNVAPPGSSAPGILVSHLLLKHSFFVPILI